MCATAWKKWRCILKQSGWFKAWEVIYPIGIYFVVTNVAMIIMGMIWPMTNENYMIQQIVATVVTFPFVYSFYRREDVGKTFVTFKAVLLVVATALAGLVFNNLIGYTSLKETSQSYQELTEAFYGSSLLLEIAGTCILIPILEELLYRGIVFARLRTWFGLSSAVILSSVIFGAMHFNLVQFIYAGCIGALLALVMEYAGLKVAIVAHMLTNLISVLRSETGVLDFLDASRTVSISATVVLTVVILIMLWGVYGRNRK